MLKKTFELTKEWLAKKKKNEVLTEESSSCQPFVLEITQRKYTIGDVINGETVPNESLIYLNYYKVPMYIEKVRERQSFRISLDTEFNKLQVENREKVSFNPSCHSLAELAKLPSATYSTTITELILGALESAEQVIIILQDHANGKSALACKGLSDALKITNTFSKVDSFTINARLYMMPMMCQLTEEHLNLFDSLTGKTKLLVRYATNFVPAHLIVKWITEWQQHQRDFVYFVFNTDQFTNLDEILAGVEFSYKDDGTVFNGIIRRDRKEVDEPGSSNQDAIKEELWFRYWRDNGRQRPRIYISIERSARPH